MATQGPNSPGTVASINSGISNPWVNKDYVKVYDGFKSYQTNYYDSDYLDVTNFGFTIPSDATINGIEVRVRGTTYAAPGDYNLLLFIARLIDESGNPSGTDYGTSDDWGWYPDPIDQTWGNSSELWGVEWTPSKINSSNFGFRIQLYADGSGMPYIDHISIAAYYTEGSGATTHIKSVNGVLTANIKNVNGLAFANVKNINGLE